MAMFLFNKIAKERNLDYVADSAGLAAFGDPINKNSVKALAKVGIENIDYTSKKLSFYAIEEAELIVVMTNEHKNALLSVGVEPSKISVLAGGISDPYGKSEEEYFECLETISDGIAELIKTL
jgi:protein-tyrosine-phosphatase